jgi:2-dehydropantoate 2-reductase
MRICIIGAGAIGGLLAARLAANGEHVTVVARGDHLRAISAHGLRLVTDEGEIAARVDATADLASLEPHDLIVLAVKAHQLTPIAADVGSLARAGGLVLTMQNGIPFWYFHKHGGPYEGRGLESVDPGGIIAQHLPVDQVIGSVVYPAAEIAEPGVIRLIEGNRFSLAELDNSPSERIQEVSRVFTAAGFKAPVVSDIRAEIWTKLWGNMSFNPISALTGATLAGICGHPQGRALASDMMREAQAVGEKLGIRFRIPLAKRIAGAEAVGEHKTSMLQDVEAGRATEVDALVGSILELGAVAEVPTPAIAAIYGCMRLLDDTLARKRAGT